METGIPSIRVGDITVNLAPERYSDDEVVLAGGVEPLLKILRTQEHHAPRWRVVYVPEKEEYLIVAHTSSGQLRSGALGAPKYKVAKRRTIPEGITVLGAQVLPQAAEVARRFALLAAAES